MRFSLRTLIIVVSFFGAFAAAWRYWPTGNETVSTDAFHWYDYSVGIVNQDYEGHLRQHDHTHGQGNYITLREGAYTRGTTGGWYYEVGIQLPYEVHESDHFDLSPAASGRQVELVGEFDRLGFLRPGEFVAFRFGNPIGGCMACDDPKSHGSVKVVSMTRETATISVKLHANIPDSWDVDIDRTFTLPRE